MRKITTRGTVEYRYSAVSSFSVVAVSFKKKIR